MGKNYLHNPSTLKIDLMLRGMRAEDRALEIEGSSGDGLDILLPGGMLANVPCGEEFTASSPYLLKSGKGKKLSLSDGTDEVEVTLVGKPSFFGEKTTTGVSFSDIVSIHGSYAVITPEPSCEFFEDGDECKYCAGGFDNKTITRTFTVEEVLEAVEAVKRETTSEIIYLSIGFSEGPDGGIEFLAPYIEAVKKHFNTLVAVEALPPKKNKWIDDTYALGADSVLYNLEIFDKELFEVICPGRAKLIGRKRYLEALKYAAGIFPNGTVASHLIVGLEPPGSTSLGVDYLTDIGVVPILPIYRPSPKRALRIEPLTAEIIIPVYKRLYKAVTEKDINMNWVGGISVVTTPIDSRGLVDDKKPLLEGFYGSKLGRKTAWGLSTLRRKLRVKGDESDESGD